MAHTLSVNCVSLWINILLTYQLVSHWILSAMRLQEPERHLVLKPGLWSLLKDCGFGPDLSPSCAGSSPRLSLVWAEVPVFGFKFQSDVNSFSMTNCKIWKINKMCVSIATTLEGRKLYTTKQSPCILGISPHWELWWFGSTKNYGHSSSQRAISIVRRSSLPSVLPPPVSSLNHNSNPEDNVIPQG